MSDIKDITIREAILSSENSVAISASAGTGKTYMLVERIKRDLIKKDNYQTYAAITFTNKAAKEVSDRLGGVQLGFVGTNDKFILNEVIVPFARDIYYQIGKKVIKTDYSEKEKKKNWTELLVRFINSGIVGTYTDAHYNFSFQLALHILKKSHAARRYLKSRYFRIYIDEYQDSDKNMHDFFMYINKVLNIPLFIVGDPKQSIYEWRGAYKKGFEDLLGNNKYDSFELLHNFRSNQQIQNYATIFMEDIKKNYVKCDLNGEVQGCFYKKEELLIEYIADWLEENKKCAFLVYTNNEAKTWADKMEHLKFVYIPRAPIDNPELDNNQVWISRCIANYFYKRRYSEYSFYDEIINPEIYDIDIIKNILKMMKGEYEKSGWTKLVVKYVKKLYSYLLDTYDEDSMYKEIEKLKETITDSQYEKSYNSDMYERIVTTIHSSKGLQYNQVIINSDNYIRNYKFKNLELHYVAITRPEERLLVIFNQNSRKADTYLRTIREAMRKIEIKGVQQSIKNVIQIVKI